MKKSTVLLFLSIALVIAGLYALTNKQESQSHDVLRVAIFAPLTGPAASGGIATKEGFELAASALRESGTKIDLEFVDTKTDPKVALAAFEQTLALKKPDAVILELSSVTRALRPVLAKRVFALATAVAAPDIADPSNNLIRFFPNSRGVAVTAAHAASVRGFKSCVIVHVNDDYGAESARMFSEAYQATGGKVRAKETFGLLDRDFRGQALKLSSLNPEAVWVTGYGPGYLAVLNQLREVGYRGTILTDWSLTAPDYFSSVIDKEGIIVVSPVVSNTLESAYKARFQKEGFMVNVAYAYDSLMLLNQAHRNSDRTPRGITDAIIKAGTFDGASGSSKILATGDIEATYGLFVISGNKLVRSDFK